jgi:hypothetical protein
MWKVHTRPTSVSDFLILLSKLQFSTEIKNLERIQSIFLLYNFFSKIQNGGFSEDVVIYEKKSKIAKIID